MILRKKREIDYKNMYREIHFDAKDVWGECIYSFKIDMMHRELSLEYKNYQGGRTANSMRLYEKDFLHFKRICNSSDNDTQTPTLNRYEFILGPNKWELRIIKCEGLPTYEIQSKDDFIPYFVEELVLLVMDLASFNNKGFRYF